MKKQDIKPRRESRDNIHGYKIYIKHSSLNRTLADCMKDVIRNTVKVH